MYLESLMRPSSFRRIAQAVPPVNGSCVLHGPWPVVLRVLAHGRCRFGAVRGLVGGQPAASTIENRVCARREVTVQLKDEQHSETPAMTWILEGAQPLKYTGPTLSGAGTEVAVEELVLSVEEIRIE